MNYAQIEILVQILIDEFRGLRKDLQTLHTTLTHPTIDEISPAAALRILGLNNRGYLPYFVNQRLLTRRKGGKSYLYFRSECVEVAQAIKDKKLFIPNARDLWKFKKQEIV